jgi:hypothetical protein
MKNKYRQKVKRDVKYIECQCTSCYNHLVNIIDLDIIWFYKLFYLTLEVVVTIDANMVIVAPVPIFAKQNTVNTIHLKSNNLAFTESYL